MIQENDNSRFQFSADDDEPEAILQDELRELKIEKLGQRVTLLTILIPCMIGVILVIAYLDIKDRVTRTSSTGAIGVQKLSKDLASKFSSLSLEQAKIKEVQAKKLPELDKSAAFLKSKLTQIQKTMTQIQKTMTQMSASRISRDELTRVTENLTQKIADIPQGLKPDFEALTLVDDQMVEDARRMSDELKTLSDNMAALDVGIDSIQKEIETLSEKAIDKDDLEFSLKLKEIGYRQSLLDKTGLLEKEIKTLKKELKALQKRTSSSTSTAPPKQPSAPVPQKPASENKTINPATENKSESKPGIIESGGIEEQTIE